SGRPDKTTTIGVSGLFFAPAVRLANASHQKQVGDAKQEQLWQPIRQSLCDAETTSCCFVSCFCLPPLVADRYAVTKRSPIEFCRQVRSLMRKFLPTRA